MCPSFPNGLEANRLTTEPLASQTEIVWTWFWANFEPFPNGEGWPGYGTGGGYGLAMGYAPERRAADVILTEEFSGIAAPAVLSESAKLLTETAALWVMQAPPPPITETPDVATVRAALTKLKQAAKAPSAIGHNQGPPLTEYVLVTEIKESVKRIEAALLVSEVEGKRSLMVAAAVKASQEVLSGALRAVGATIVTGTAGLVVAGTYGYLPTLHRALVDLLTVLGQWWLAYSQH